jgi:hypothetical protein
METAIEDENKKYILKINVDMKCHERKAPLQLMMMKWATMRRVTVTKRWRRPNPKRLDGLVLHCPKGS